MINGKLQLKQACSRDINLKCPGNQPVSYRPFTSANDYFQEFLDVIRILFHPL